MSCNFKETLKEQNRKIRSKWASSLTWPIQKLLKKLKVVAVLYSQCYKVIDAVRQYTETHSTGSLWECVSLKMAWIKTKNGAAQRQRAQVSPALLQESHSGPQGERTRLLLSLGKAGCQLVGFPLRWCATVYREIGKKKTVETHTIRECFIKMTGYGSQSPSPQLGLWQRSRKGSTPLCCPRSWTGQSLLHGLQWAEKPSGQQSTAAWLPPPGFAEKGKQIFNTIRGIEEL